MLLQQLLVRLALDASQRLVVLLHRVTADVVIVHVIGSGGDIERRSSGVVHRYRRGLMLNLTVRLHQDATLGFQTSLDAFLFHTVNNGCQLVDASFDAFMFENRKDLCNQLAVEAHVELQLALLRGFQSYDDDIICLRSKDGTHILHAIHLVGSGV